MVGTIIGAIIIGAIVGALARLVLPGKQNISMLVTIVLGHPRVPHRLLHLPLPRWR